MLIASGAARESTWCEVGGAHVQIHGTCARMCARAGHECAGSAAARAHADPRGRGGRAEACLHTGGRGGAGGLGWGVGWGWGDGVGVWVGMWLGEGGRGWATKRQRGPSVRFNQQQLQLLLPPPQALVAVAVAVAPAVVVVVVVVEILIPLSYHCCCRRCGVSSGPRLGRYRIKGCTPLGL